MEILIEKTRVDESCCDDTCCGSTSEKTDKGSRSKAEEIKKIVKSNYAEFAKQADESEACGCGCGCGTSDVSFAPEQYRDEVGYSKKADLGLGCGMPTQFANLQPGDNVRDPGSGGGLDAFIAREQVGKTGSVTGVDMTEEMIALARKNADALGYDNVSFLLGDIEELPVPESSIDVVLSNCVLNLVPDKQKAFREIGRVLKKGGRFSISDIVYAGKLDETIRNSVALYVGCVAGAVSFEEYLNLLFVNGFSDVQVRSISRVNIEGFEIDSPEVNAAKKFAREGGVVYSITVTGKL